MMISNLLMKRFQSPLFLIACSFFLLVGCSNNAQIKGKVTLTDGTPVARGHVIFEQGAFAAQGEIQPDGSYTMGSLKATDGLPKGEYVVYIRGATQAGNAVNFQTLGADGKMTTMSIPSLDSVVAKDYTSGTTSPLRCNVQKSMTFDIEVPPAGM